MVIQDGYFKHANNQDKQAVIASKISSIIKTMDIKSDCQELIDIIEGQMNNQQEVKRLVQILIETFGNELDEKFIQLTIKVAKQSKTS